MSLNVLVVPENPTYNGAILKPLCECVLVECGRPRANVEVMANPRTNGYEHAKSLFREAIMDLYSHKHLVLFLPDSDGQDRSGEFARLEADFELQAVAIAKPIRLICCAAVPEVEAWLLAGHTDKWEQEWQWGTMRADRSIKENYFIRFFRRMAKTSCVTRTRAANNSCWQPCETTPPSSSVVLSCRNLKIASERTSLAFSDPHISKWGDRASVFS